MGGGKGQAASNFVGDTMKVRALTSNVGFGAGTFIRDIRDVGTSRIFRMFRMSRITRKIPVHRKCCEIAAHMRFPSAACARARPPELLCASLELCKHVHD